MKPFIRFAMWLMALALVACADERQSTAYANIDDQQLKQLLAEGVPLIDIRRPEEWRQTGIIEGAHPITLFGPGGRVYQDFFDRLAKIAPKDKPVALICRTGHRSRIASDYLSKQLGYTHLYNVAHGITGWIRNGNPVVEYSP